MTLEGQVAEMADAVDELATQVAALRALVEQDRAPVLAVTKGVAAEMCSVGAPTIRPLFDAPGGIATVRIGGSVRVPVRELEEYLSREAGRRVKEVAA